MNEYDDSEFEEKNDNLEFFTRQEVMDLLKLDQRTYHLYINKGILKPYRSSPKSKKFLFKRAEIEQVFKPTITTKIISVINQKGGVGKTTLTHNIGFGFSSRGYKTLLIDSDPQENLSRGLGMPKDMEPEKTLVAIFDKYKKNDAGLEEIVHQLGENLFLIPSSIILSGVETESDINIYFRLKTYIQHIYMDYDFIIIDCPPSLGTLTTNALIASEYVLIPICPDFYSPLGTEQLMKKINETKEYNPSLKIIGAVINQKDSRTTLGNDISTELKSELKTLMFETEINYNTKIKEAPFKNQSVLEYEKSSQGATDIRSLIDEILERIKG